MPDREWWAALWPEPEVAPRAMGLEDGMAAGDLCCGDGYFTVPLARIVRRLVQGIDLDLRLLELASAEVKRAKVSPCVFIQGNARELAQLIPEQVDYIFLANTLHGVESKTELGRDVRAALRSGGHFGIANWHRQPCEETIILGKPRGPRTDSRMTLEDTQQAVVPAGFQLERLADLPPHHYGAVFLKSAGKSK